MTAFAPGAVVGERYELTRPLGAGGLAQVFAARDRQTGEEVALKALHEHLLFDAQLVERFRRELAVTARLKHPNIVQVFQLHEHLGRPFFSMELLQGESLAERLRRGALPLEEALRIAGAICRALEAAHRAGIVHRDVKPQNIFLTAEGGVKLLDFGLARAAGYARLTAQSTVLGTPGYVAPEILSGSGADPRSDLYSLGATLFEMLAGQRAFPFADPYRVLRGQREPAPSVRKLRPELPRAVDQLIARAMAPDPEQRFSDARQLGQALAGGAVPAPQRVPLGFTAGKFEVLVHANRELSAEERKAAVERLCWALGVEEKKSRRWAQRLAIWQAAPLVQGCSRESAQAIAALCQERGLPAIVQEQRERPLRWWVRGGLVATASALLPELLNTISNLHPSLLQVGLSSAMGASLLGWVIYTARAKPPIRDLPEGDPAVRRLLDGIARRGVRFRERIDALPEPMRLILGDLVQAVGQIMVAAQAIGERAARLPTEDDPEARTWPPGHAPAETRDQLVAQLLEIAASLDQAFAAAEAPSPEEPAQLALQRLREETSFAERALPEVVALLEGRSAG